MSKKKPIIAIDGPAGSGKSTLGKALARELKLLYIDSGAMYRAFGLKCHRMKINPHDIKKISDILQSTDIVLKTDGEGLKVLLDNVDVTGDIRSPEAGKAASIYSVIPIVREEMVRLQRKLAENGGVVMDGRDIGSVVFPNADLKIFLEASSRTRAVRRYLELYDEQPDPDSNEFIKLWHDQKTRDKADEERENSPLTKAVDAVTLDSTMFNRNEVLQRALELLDK